MMMIGDAYAFCPLPLTLNGFRHPSPAVTRGLVTRCMNIPLAPDADVQVSVI